MYRANRNYGANSGETISQAGCFVEKTMNWLWIIAIFVFGSIIYAIVTALAPEPAYPGTGGQYQQVGQFLNVALSRCPYCTGFLDSNGKCNVPKCPIYSPNWGKLSSPAGLPVKKVLVRELAMEVGASQGKNSVVISSVYGAGNAEKAGLRVGDRIVRFNGRSIKNVRQFTSTVARARPEANVKIHVMRNGQKTSCVVMVGEGEMEGVTIPTTQG